MSTYQVKGSDYFEGLPRGVRFSSSETWTGTAENILRCSEPIRQLVSRFGLVGKTVLSLGAGTGFEEATMYRLGCRVILNDLDVPHHGIEPYLRSLTSSPGGDLTFHIEDAAQTISRYENEIDVLYVSSFHPDEMRRADIQEEHLSRRFPPRTRQILSRVVRRLPVVSWPTDADPYCPLLMDALSTVRSEGLVIFQHYCSGVNFKKDPHYLGALGRQLAQNGCVLLEAYCYRSNPSIQLIVGRKASGRAVNGPPSTMFHGRYPDQTRSRNISRIL